MVSMIIYGGGFLCTIICFYRSFFLNLFYHNYGCAVVVQILEGALVFVN